MRKKLTRLATIGVAFAAATVGLMSSTASALPASSGPVSLSPATGNSDTVLTILPPSGAACPGDTATNGYRVQTFFVDNSIDPATLTYDTDGPVAQGSALVIPLFSTSGGAQSNINTANSTGIITNLTQDHFGDPPFSPGVIPSGIYKFGYACTLSGVTQKFWMSSLTIAANSATGGSAQITYALNPVLPPDVPEVPFAVLLPASAVGLLGGATLVARKRRKRAVAA